MKPQKTKFVFNPLAYPDLTPPPGSDTRAVEEHSYIIERNVGISKTDYENFLSDMHHHRDFLEQNASYCHIDEDGVWHCLLVHPNRQTLGILVMPHDTEFYPKWAAIKPD